MKKIMKKSRKTVHKKMSLCKKIFLALAAVLASIAAVFGISAAKYNKKVDEYFAANIAGYQQATKREKHERRRKRNGK